jgi:7,8-dihydroneopterin aldolase/epimerase/oxygenase
LKDFALELHLGCSHEERKEPQEVRLDMELRFPLLLQAGESDKLEDAVCYGRLAEAIVLHFLDSSKERIPERSGEGVKRREYLLIERVAEEAYKIIKEMSKGALVSVEVKKVNPPVERLLGGAFFRVGDFP